MLEDFAAPVGLDLQVAKAMELFSTAYPLAIDLCDRPESVEQFIRHIGKEIHKSFGSNNFKTDRLNRKTRLECGMDLSKRRYNKLFRHLVRMEKRINKLIGEIKKLMFTKVGKSGLAQVLSQTEFDKCRDTACFIAYYVARSNLRSEFTIYGQQRAYDEIADMLLDRCRKNAATNWLAIAHVYPTKEILVYLTDVQKGELLGRWYELLTEIATFLEKIWHRSTIERATMIVRRGNDSSTWNSMAAAWNTARKNWIAFQPTPELVHGVSVANPLLAKLLRDAGFFAGKSTNPSLEIDGERLFLHQDTLAAHYQRLQERGDRVE